jgi:hypothetical protein
MTWEAELVEALEAARGVRGKATEVIDAFRARTGKSAQSLYRIAARNGYQRKRKRRSDMGDCTLNDDQIRYVAGLINETGREIKGSIMPVERALQIAVDSGVIEAGCISPSRMTDLLRDRGLCAAALEAPDPHIKMKSLHPNHVHVVDVSVCIQYYLKGGGIRIMREDMFYRNKPENFMKIKKKILRYVIVDHYSGMIWWQYYEAAGETADNFFDFLVTTWSAAKHPKLPFRGVPKYLLMDAGAANLAASVVKLLERLDVEIPKSLPHNPRRQGSCEGAHNLVERWFESGLKISRATTTEELNAWALDFAVWLNGARKHTRHGMTRTGCWLRIKSEELRELPDMDLVRELYAAPVQQCHVYGDSSIRFKGERFSVRHVAGIAPGVSKVEVELRPYDWPESVAVTFKDVEYRAEIIRTDDAGFDADAVVIGERYKARPETDLQKAKKEMSEMAYGEEKAKDAVPFAGAAVYGHHADKIAFEPMPKKGVPLQTTRTAADMDETEISFMDLLKRLRAAGCEMDTELNQALRKKYGASVPLADADAIEAAARQGNVWMGFMPGLFGQQAAGNE